MNTPTEYVYALNSPIGVLQLVSNGTALLRVEFENQHSTSDSATGDPILTRAAAQLNEYFAGTRRAFDLPLAAQGTDFQRRVWGQLQCIPYGEVCSYADIAQAIDKPTAMRAVGAANGRNPLPVIVPCHRVIGSSGKLTGFAGGLPAKRTLLSLEGIQVED